MRRLRWHFFILLFVVLTCLFLYTPSAFGEDAPSVDDRKGTAPAEGTWLDREYYADGSEYENPPTEVEYVRIGLYFGDSAVDYLILESDDGCGFSIGYYDWQRHFIETSKIDDPYLTVTVFSEDEGGLTILRGVDQEVVFQAGAAATVALRPISGTTRVSGRSYRGSFDFCKTYDDRMIVVNCLGLEDYVKGVVPYEMAVGWPKEALKAQAVCARTYVVYNQNQFAEYGFDLTDSTLCQVYSGIDGANWWTDQAVDETRGELIRYKGEICEIYYSAGDGGMTEDGSNVFGSDRPYLSGKIDPFEAAEDYYYESWVNEIDGFDLMILLNLKQYALKDVVKKIIPEYSSLGNVIAMTFIDENGERLRLEGRDCYTALKLPSCRFKISRDESFFVFTGSGLGHNCGLSQWGAKAMDEIYGYDYNDIIRFYFTGAYIA